MVAPAFFAVTVDAGACAVGASADACTEDVAVGAAVQSDGEKKMKMHRVSGVLWRDNIFMLKN